METSGKCVSSAGYEAGTGPAGFGSGPTPSNSSTPAAGAQTTQGSITATAAVPSRNFEPTGTGECSSSSNSTTGVPMSDGVKGPTALNLAPNQGAAQDSNKRKRTIESTASGSSSSKGTTNTNTTASKNSSRISRNDSQQSVAAAVTMKAAERTSFVSFWGDGTPKNGRVEYDGFNVSIGRDLYEIGVGDAVMLRTYNADHAAAFTAGTSTSAVSGQGTSSTADEADNNDYAADSLTGSPSEYYKSVGMSHDKYGSKNGSGVLMQRDPKTGDNLMLARVERVWQEKGRGGKPGQVLFQARWFLKIDDVHSLPLDSVSGPASSDEMLMLITEHDVVLSNQCDSNHVTTICGLVQVLYRRPEADKDGLPSHILPSTYICRYSLTIEEKDNDRPEIFLVPYSGSNDDWGEMTIGAVNPPTAVQYEKKTEVRVQLEPHQDSMDTTSNTGRLARGAAAEDSESELSQFESRSKKQRRDILEEMSVLEEETIDEGTTEQRDIRVGHAHQVYVPPFEGPRPSISRNPLCVWKRVATNQEDIDEYMEQATKILTPILQHNAWTQEDPHVPFPVSRLESISKSLDPNRLPTLSSISTASSLSSQKIDADGPLREFDCDALLCNLYASNYNIPNALSTIRQSPRAFITVWDRNQTALFNSGFRRFAGSLRATLKGLKPEKTLEDVIDYHYRFKIPYMFNRFQDRKREQAVRMLECIETRRSIETPILVPGCQECMGSSSQSAKKTATGSDEANLNGQDWSKTSVPSMGMSVEERRRRAKQFLLDVEAKLGKHKLMEIMKMMDSWEQLSFIEAKTKLLHITRGYPDLQSRAVEFFPQSRRI